MFLNSQLLNNLIGLEAKRKRLLAKAPQGPMADFLSIPFPTMDTPLEQLPILSVDFETTGLNYQHHHILSIGYVTMIQKHIKLSSCYHQIINIEQKLQSDNVLIHQITDDHKSQGQPLQQVIPQLLQALAGKVMLVHYQHIEKNFLAKACQQLYGIAPIYPIIDTMTIAKRQLERQQQSYHPSQLRLSNLRASYQLPEHYSHNALNDAIATAELLLAQTAHQNVQPTLADLIAC